MSFADHQDFIRDAEGIDEPTSEPVRHSSGDPWTGDLIREGRKAVGMTQEQLAEAMDVQQPTISEWECNKLVPRFANVLRLASLLNLDISVLVGGRAT